MHTTDHRYRHGGSPAPAAVAGAPAGPGGSPITVVTVPDKAAAPAVGRRSRVSPSRLFSSLDGRQLLSANPRVATAATRSDVGATSPSVVSSAVPSPKASEASLPGSLPAAWSDADAGSASDQPRVNGGRQRGTATDVTSASASLSPGRRRAPDRVDTGSGRQRLGRGLAGVWGGVGGGEGTSKAVVAPESVAATVMRTFPTGKVSGTFVDRSHEAAYLRHRAATRSKGSKVASACMAGFALLSVMMPLVTMVFADTPVPTAFWAFVALTTVSGAAIVAGGVVPASWWPGNAQTVAWRSRVGLLGFAGVLVAQSLHRTVLTCAALSATHKPNGTLNLDSLPATVVCGVGERGVVNFRVLLVPIVVIILVAGPLDCPLRPSFLIAVLGTVTSGLSVAYHNEFPVHAIQAMIALAFTLQLMVGFSKMYNTERRQAWANLSAAVDSFKSKLDAEAERTRAEVKMTEAQAEVTLFERFTRYLCHELRNPLHGIMGLLDGAKEDGSLTISDLGSCMTTAKHMSTILDDVLDLGQLQQGRMKLDPEPTDVAGVITDVVQSLQRTARVPVTIHVSPKVPTALNVDHLRFAQIVTNALSNSLKATKAGRVDLYTFIEGDALHVELLDTGRGIGNTDPTTLFQAYAQVSQSPLPGSTERLSASEGVGKRYKKGTGLGLAITARLVELMQGEIGIRNRCDAANGAHFWLVLPLEQLDISKSASATSLEAPTLTVAAYDRGPVGIATMPCGRNAGATVPFHVRSVLPRTRMSSRFLLGSSASSRSGTPTEGEPVRRTGSSLSRVGPLVHVTEDGEELEAKADDSMEGGIDTRQLPSGHSLSFVSFDGGAKMSGGGTPGGQMFSSISIGRPRRDRLPKASSSKRMPSHGRVLVCDDELLNRRILGRHVRKLGFSVQDYEDGDDLLAYAMDGHIADGCVVDTDGSPYAAIFLDIMMERSSGEDVCRQLRAAGVHKTPMFAATGNGLRRDCDRYCSPSIGFSGVLLKPFTGANVKTLLVEAGALPKAPSPGSDGSKADRRPPAPTS